MFNPDIEVGFKNVVSEISVIACNLKSKQVLNEKTPRVNTLVLLAFRILEKDELKSNLVC